MKIVKLLTALLFVTTLTYIVAIPEKTLNYSQRLAKKIADLDARIEAEENVNMRAELEAQRDTCQAKLTTRKASNCKASKTHRAHRIAEGKPSREPKITICKLKDLIDAINGRLQIEADSVVISRVSLRFMPLRLLRYTKNVI